MVLKKAKLAVNFKKFEALNLSLSNIKFFLYFFRLPNQSYMLLYKLVLV